MSILLDSDNNTSSWGSGGAEQPPQSEVVQFQSDTWVWSKFGMAWYLKMGWPQAMPSDFQIQNQWWTYVYIYTLYTYIYTHIFIHTYIYNCGPQPIANLDLKVGLGQRVNGCKPTPQSFRSPDMTWAKLPDVGGYGWIGIFSEFLKPFLKHG
jgi:hypothetical protein